MGELKHAAAECTASSSRASPLLPCAADLAPLSLGKLTSLAEIEWVRREAQHCPSLHYYYLGYYIHTCHRMRYKVGPGSVRWEHGGAPCCVSGPNKEWNSWLLPAWLPGSLVQLVHAYTLPPLPLPLPLQGHFGPSDLLCPKNKCWVPLVRVEAALDEVSGGGVEEAVRGAPGIAAMNSVL